MSSVIPQVGDLVYYNDELCFITGFRKLRQFERDHSVMVILNFDETTGGKGIIWNNIRFVLPVGCSAGFGEPHHTHLVQNNEGVWKVAAKQGEDPLFIEWLKHNS